jgi:hypothetical protein
MWRRATWGSVPGSLSANTRVSPCAGTGAKTDLFGSGLFFIPGIGPLAVAGPIVSWIVAGLEGAAVVGGLGALGAALFAMGIPKDSVLKYETAIKADKFLVLVHGTAENAQRAKQILDKVGPTAAAVHLD